MTRANALTEALIMLDTRATAYERRAAAAKARGESDPPQALIADELRDIAAKVRALLVTA